MHLPDWLKVKASGQHATKSILRNRQVATVCEQARCPNRGFCFSRPTATFLILGEICTRSCWFCAVMHGKPSAPDPAEPGRVALAAGDMGLTYVVVTSVTRDDLHDGGAGQFASAIREIRKVLPGAGIEVLTPDFLGRRESIETVLEAGPDVFNHNMETVRRLYAPVRPQASYERSLEVLRRAKELAPHIRTKTGLMVGLGEEAREIEELFHDVRQAACDMITVGQYLRPGKANMPVVEYRKPEFFERLKERAYAAGFEFVASGPLVRSSMNADEMYRGRRDV